MEFELTELHFVKANRTACFDLHLETLEQLLPWIFALDHTNYARDLPIHLRDMYSLKYMHPAVHKEFTEGRFVGQKTHRNFSCLALDQMHEQLICTIKGDGGIIDRKEDPEALRRARCLREQNPNRNLLESEISAVTASPTADVNILDGTFTVQAPRPGTAST
ncbi:hypothetical protein PoB_001891400 [Plakobranchus ocellatus]|uniref:Uncharacterized protein n=1 Tax=Plakobranchus ocellatus TaxID=259542 RepID=A0AAV3ZEW4_9GAST|nr:hypothetical protein PoB_001891400 [Plakobranchus ocellatus]